MVLGEKHGTNYLPYTQSLIEKGSMKPLICKINDIMKPFLRKASFPVLYFLFLPGALLHTSTDHVQNSSYTLPLTLLKSSFSTLQNIILSTFLLMQLQRQSVRVMKESHLLAGIIINPNRLTFYA